MLLTEKQSIKIEEFKLKKREVYSVCFSQSGIGKLRGAFHIPAATHNVVGHFFWGDGFYQAILVLIDKVMLTLLCQSKQEF